MPAGKFSRAEANYAIQGIHRAITAQENQKLARIQIEDALRTVLEAFELGHLDKEVDAEFPRGSVYGIVKAAYARIEEARL
jgi:hypothetical protein